MVWAEQQPVRLNLRRPFNDSEFEAREEQSWPLPRTKWFSIYLSARDLTLSCDKPKQPAGLALDALKKLVTLMPPPLRAETETTGSLAAKIFVSSSTSDMDLFLTFQPFSPDGRELDFQGTVDPHTFGSRVATSITS